MMERVLFMAWSASAEYRHPHSAWQQGSSASSMNDRKISHLRVKRDLIGVTIAGALSTF
jgi:hypothetical protein